MEAKQGCPFLVRRRGFWHNFFLPRICLTPSPSLLQILVFLTCFQTFFLYLLQTTENFCRLHRHFCHKTQCTDRQGSCTLTRLFGGGTLFVLRKISAEFLCTVQLLWMCLQGRNVNVFTAITFWYMSTMPQRPFFIFAHVRMLCKCWLRRLVSETLSEQKELPQQITLEAWSAGLKSSEMTPLEFVVGFLA